MSQILIFTMKISQTYERFFLFYVIELAEDIVNVTPTKGSNGNNPVWNANILTEDGSL